MGTVLMTLNAETKVLRVNTISKAMQLFVKTRFFYYSISLPPFKVSLQKAAFSTSHF
jgi:hypothetical protein